MIAAIVIGVPFATLIIVNYIRELQGKTMLGVNELRNLFSKEK